MQTGSVIAVAVIEDILEVREGLAMLLRGTPGFGCCGAYPTMEEALRSIAITRPDVVVSDLGLPGMSGAKGIQILRERDPDLPIIALSILDDDDSVFAAICAGAYGYLLKSTPPARLLESIREVASGGAPMSPPIARRVVALFRDFRPPDSAACRLTPQETEVLRLLVLGHHYKSAAAKMGISRHTVSFHLRNIYTKLQVHSKSEAIVRALRERLV